ncbi:MAG TPA: DUF6636 domain-containing protein [Pseudonocardiaceae bacterium]|nr:DUF6636 domain-containing protein [Pseudonocardiaceae bacterium]
MTKRSGRITRLALIASATAAASLTLPATAHGDDFNYKRFQSPSGDIMCVMVRNHDRDDPASNGKGEGTCQVLDAAYAMPPRQYVGGDGRPSTCWLGGWGSQISLPEGIPPHLDCVGNVLALPSLPTLDVGQTESVGAITCASEPSAMRCTDTSSGRFFRVSSDSYELG